MIDLRERLQELADAAVREGATPGPAHAIRRGRQRRRRITAATATLLVVTLGLGVAGIAGRLPDRTTMQPLTPTVTSPPRGTLPSPLPEGVRTDQPRRGSPEARAFAILATELRRCPGSASAPAELIAYLWSQEYRWLWMVAAKRPSPQGRFCWTAGMFDAKVQGTYWGAQRIRSPSTPLTSLGGIYSGFAQIEGRVTRQAARVRLRFRDGRPPMDLTIVETGRRYPANFYVGFFPQEPTSPQKGGWAAATVTALDAAGRTITTCRVKPRDDGMPKCPGN